jgi:hypothetical protein
MAAVSTTTIVSVLTGLGLSEEFVDTFTTTTTPSAKAKIYQAQAVADTDEALDIGDVSTVELIIIRCVTNDVDVDCNYSSSFSADITVQEGEVAVFKPAGTVQLKNNDAGEQFTIEAIVIGT